MKLSTKLKKIEKNVMKKSDYYVKETARRNTELATVDSATGIFDGILLKLSQRVKDRASNISTGADAGGDLSQKVATSSVAVAGAVDSQASARTNVVFTQF